MSSGRASRRIIRMLLPSSEKTYPRVARVACNSAFQQREKGFPAVDDAVGGEPAHRLLAGLAEADAQVAVLHESLQPVGHAGHVAGRHDQSAADLVVDQLADAGRAVEGDRG